MKRKRNYKEVRIKSKKKKEEEKELKREYISHIPLNVFLTFYNLENKISYKSDIKVNYLL